MNEDLANEVEAINSIYGDNSLVISNEPDIYVLHLPQQDASLRLRFPKDYPATPPAVLGTESSGEHGRKGDAAHVVEIFRDVLAELYRPGEVCLFDVIEEIHNLLPDANGEDGVTEDALGIQYKEEAADVAEGEVKAGEAPPWTLSEVVIELKSVFIARSAPVSSPSQANSYLQHLLDSDKKVRSASHNITAWRIKGENGVTYQDCDDDGETAAGGRVLHLMQLMELWDVMVVVTRWYGGHQLGPKRFSIINTVAREAFVRGNFVKEDPLGKKKGKR
ncbi:Protein IMPACT-like protein [Lachnellula willkommii]|uniref:Protein IMPACT-like protein n=1 Tax=Lachnellula willkommii TaxID=215461 RepID=A0A559M0M9_9HELO|nr:Protein IMPACT-like protein [Lachnellula willkommii]